MLEKTVLVETRIITTRKIDFMIEYTIRSSTVDAELARDTESLLYCYSRTKGLASVENEVGTYCLYGHSGLVQFGKYLQFSVSFLFTPSTAGLGCPISHWH